MVPGLSTFRNVLVSQKTKDVWGMFMLAAWMNLIKTVKSNIKFIGREVS